MNDEEKKSVLYFVYLRYCKSNPKSFDEITVEEMKKFIDDCKNVQCDSKD